MSMTVAPNTILYKTYCTESTPAQPLVCAKEKASAAWTKMFSDNELFSWTMHPCNAKEDAHFLTQLPIPTHVTMFNIIWDDKALEYLMRIPNLQSLSVPSLMITNYLTFLNNNYSLTDLDLSNSSLHPGCTLYNSLKNNHWTTFGNTQERWSYLEWMKRVPHLQALKLPSFVDDAYVDLLVRTLTAQGKSLRSLSLKNCANVTDKSIPLLTKLCPTLQSLDLSGTSVTDRGVNSSIPLWCIPKLNLSECLGITPLDKLRKDTLNVETCGCGRKLQHDGYDESGESWGTLTYKNEAIKAGYEAGHFTAHMHDIKRINIHVLNA